MSTQSIVNEDLATGDADAQAAAKRVLVGLTLAPFLGALVFAGAPPLFPAMAHDLGVSVSLLGQIVTVMLLLGAILSLAVGPLADRHGSLPLLLLGAVAAAVCLLGFGLAPGYPPLFGAAILGGLANATLPSLSLAMAKTTFTGALRNRAIGWATAGGAGAAVVGVPALTAVAAVAGWRVAFIGAGFVALAATGLLRITLSRSMPRPAKSPQVTSLLAAYRPLLSHTPTLRLYGVTVLRAVCWFGLLTYLGAFLGEELGLGPSGIGVAYLLGGSGYVAGSLGAGRLLAYVPARPLVAATNAALALSLGFLFWPILGIAGSMLLLPLTGFLGAVGWVGVAALLVEESQAGSGTTMALNGALTNLGAAGGGALGGLLLAVGGYGALAVGLPVAALSAALLVGSRVKKPRRHEGEDSGHASLLPRLGSPSEPPVT